MMKYYYSYISNQEVQIEVQLQGNCYVHKIPKESITKELLCETPKDNSLFFL